MLLVIVLAVTKIRETFPSVKKRKTRILDEKLTTKENHKESLVELIEEDGFLKTFWRFIHSTAILITFQSVICRQTVCAAINTMTSMYITFPEIDEDDSIFDRYFIRFSHRLIRRVLRASLSTYGGIERFMRDEIDEDYGIRDIVDVQLRIGGIIQFLSTSDDELLDFIVGSDEDQTLLHMTCRRGNLAVANAILGSLSQESLCIVLAQKDGNGDTPLHTACKSSSQNKAAITALIIDSLPKHVVEWHMRSENQDKLDISELLSCCKMSIFADVSTLSSTLIDYRDSSRECASRALERIYMLHMGLLLKTFGDAEQIMKNIIEKFPMIAYTNDILAFHQRSFTSGESSCHDFDDFEFAFDKKPQDCTILHKLCQRGNQMLLETVIRSMYALQMRQLLLHRDQHGNTPLHNTCQSNCQSRASIAIALLKNIPSESLEEQLTTVNHFKLDVTHYLIKSSGLLDDILSHLPPERKFLLMKAKSRTGDSVLHRVMAQDNSVSLMAHLKTIKQELNPEHFIELLKLRGRDGNPPLYVLMSNWTIWDVDNHELQSILFSGIDSQQEEEILTLKNDRGFTVSDPEGQLGDKLSFLKLRFIQRQTKLIRDKGTAQSGRPKRYIL